MSDYEMASLASELINSLWTIFATYVSIVFAFLVAGYLVSGKLAPRIVTVVVMLYTLVAIWSLFALNRTATTVIGLALEIKRAALEPGSSLSWHPAVTTPEFMFTALPALIAAVAIAAYAGSIYFFFHQRKVSLSRGH